MYRNAGSRNDLRMPAEARRRGMVVLLLLSIAAEWPGGAAGQAPSPVRVFSPLPTTQPGPLPDESDQAAGDRAAQILRLREDPATAAMEVVGAQPALLPEADAVVLTVFGLDLQFRTFRVDRRSTSQWTWVGRSQAGHAILVVDGARVAGSIQAGGASYSVTPLGPGLAAIILTDMTRTLPDLPPLQPLVPGDDEPAQAAVVESGAVFTVGVFYTTAAAGYVQGTLGRTLDQNSQIALTEMNTTYLNSFVGTGSGGGFVPLQAELAGSFITAYNENHCSPSLPACNDTNLDLTRFRTPGDGFLDEVHGVRDRIGADVCILMTLVEDSGGRATLNATASSAFGVVRVQQGTGAPYSIAHEIGHVQGAAHNAEQLAIEQASPAYSYGRGYGGPGPNPAGRTWMTVMSYSSACSPPCSTTIPYFSNPNVSYLGWPTGNAATADNARVLNERKETVANFRHGTGPVAVAPQGLRVAEGEDTATFGHGAIGGASPVRQVTVTNVGSAPFSVTSVTVNSPDFSILNVSGLGSVAAGAGMTFDVRFNPKLRGTRTARVSVYHTSSLTPSPSTFYVTGRAGDAAAAIDPASPLPIPPHDGVSTPGLLTSTLNSAVTGTVGQLRVNVDVDPRNVFFSSLTLKHPDMTAVVLYPYGGGVNSFGSGLSGTQFADAAATAFSAGTSPYTGAFRPAGNLGTLAGKPASGTWTLEARSWVTGSPQPGLSGWSIQFGADAPAANPLDFNGDGKPDILWRNTSTGDNYVWYMNGIARAGGDWILRLSDPNWRIVGTGDFNSDGKPDILWRNAVTGENYIWYMNGSVRTDGTYLTPVADVNWKIVGVDDFNGDGNLDLLWRNTSTGQNYVWFMNGITRTGGDWVLGVADQNWKITGTGDFNGDGKPDILWRNAVTGENYVWYMNGHARADGSYLAAVADPNWQIVEIADFNADGKPDILWRNAASGDNYIWYMNGIVRTDGTYLLGVPDSSWKIAPQRP